MDQTARDSYLEAQVMTATPQKLRLMLIEAALRFARAAHAAQLQERHDEVFEATLRCRQIITELISSIDTEYSPLTKKVAALYVFLFQSLTEAQLRRDVAKFQDVINILEVERDTWRLLCERMPFAPDVASTQPKEITATGNVIMPSFGTAAPARQSFSLDA